MEAFTEGFANIMPDSIPSRYDSPAAAAAQQAALPVPQYLQAHYWWAYVHPNAVHVFERQWLVNLILWGNYTRLCNAVLRGYGESLPGRTLQIACAYGDLTPRLAQCVAPDGQLDVIDILPIQLDNLASKLPHDARVKLHCMDSAALGFGNGHFDRALLFFLLHEQPLDVRQKTLAEALRVVRPGGTLTIVDYARPSRLNPLHYVWEPVLDRLEPFACDLWREEVVSWLPEDAKIASIHQDRFFGGLYQRLTMTMAE
jgi:ubiquinone/menaquinone biosynthesis C-methylase UbiE